MAQSFPHKRKLSVQNRHTRESESGSDGGIKGMQELQRESMKLLTEALKKRYPNGKQSCYKGSNSHDSSRCLLDSESETLSGESTCFVGKGKRRATDPKPKEQRRSKDTMIPRRRDSGRRKSTRGPGSESELTDFDTWIRRFEQRKRCKSSGHRRGSNERRRSRSPSSRHKSFIQRYREYASENPAMASRRRACLICSDQGRLGACWNCGRKTGGLR